MEKEFKAVAVWIVYAQASPEDDLDFVVVQTDKATAEHDARECVESGDYAFAWIVSGWTSSEGEDDEAD